MLLELFSRLSRILSPAKSMPTSLDSSASPVSSQAPSQGSSSNQSSTTNFTLSARSLAKLEGVDERLVAVVKRAIQITSEDFAVIEGLRSQERQAELYAQGRTKPGQIVTWTMDSPHLHGKAVDLVPYPVDWNDLKRFDAVAHAMFTAANELNTKIRWGADWDMDGKPRGKGESDSPHFELA